ncbi:unnamed protein product [Cyprideis torosa]|uniref:Uncharacterized protein n=1 Tax=Cyprideis torosa TaxID=163714 RepID=A0A7R8ZSM2_9CRUS|nr:unnamed protein product [Cyprideis torosa]CAG0896407.1 unnamed protein product [Cyprideis torosa]
MVGTLHPVTSTTSIGGGKFNLRPVQYGQVEVIPVTKKRYTSLVPPIRQTASIFKQPVTVAKYPGECQTKNDMDVLKTPREGDIPRFLEQPRQLFWEKRLQGLRATCIDDGFMEVDSGEEEQTLPQDISPAGPNIPVKTAIQSVSAALHTTTRPILGQTSTKPNLEKFPDSFLNPLQPLVHTKVIHEEIIRAQEDRVREVRRLLQDALAQTS